MSISTTTNGCPWITTVSSYYYPTQPFIDSTKPERPYIEDLFEFFVRPNFVFYYYPRQYRVCMIGYTGEMEKLYPAYLKYLSSEESIQEVSQFFREYGIFEDPSIDISVRFANTSARISKRLTEKALDGLFLRFSSTEHTIAQLINQVNSAVIPEPRNIVAEAIKKLISQNS